MTTPTLAAHVLAKIIVGQKVDSYYLEQIDPDCQEIAAAVLAAPPSSTLRAQAFMAATAGRDDGAEIRAAVEKANPAADLESFKPENSDPWQAFTLADSYAERPPVQYVANGLFVTPSLNVVYGAPGTLKSLLMADLSICVAAGVEWLPPAPWIAGNEATSIETTQAPSMWLDFDNGRNRTHNRFEALGRARELPPETPLIYYSMPAPWLVATDKTSIGNLTLRIHEKGSKLVIIDNLGVVSGDADENSAEMGQVMSRFRQVAEETEAALVLIHHQRKSLGTGGRAGDSLRGHSSIEAALDLALWIEREELADMITIKATKVRGAEVYPFGAHFTCEQKPDGELQTAKFFGVVTADLKSDSAIEREILAALAGDPINKTELVKAVKEALTDETGKSPGVNRIRNSIDRMENTQKILSTRGERTEKVYTKL